MKTGRVYWITGLAGAGKTTIGRALCRALRRQGAMVVFLDGDSLREVFGSKPGYSPSRRKQLAFAYARLCKMLSEQSLDVVCSTISLFREVHQFNRRYLRRYCEVFVDCPLEELRRRDQKGIYSAAFSGKAKHVMGVDVPFDRPHRCHVTIDNRRPDRLAQKVELILKTRV